MSRPVLFLDVSRLARRYEHFGGPTGIDRVELRYAQWLLVQDRFEPRPVVQAQRGLVELRKAAFAQLLGTLMERWSSAAPPQIGRNGRSAIAYRMAGLAGAARRMALTLPARTRARSTRESALRTRDA